MFVGVASLALAGCAAGPPPPRMLPDPATCSQEAAPSVVVVARFYEAFGRHDFQGMACSYGPNIEFTDSIFGTLRGKRALAMWAMVVEQGKDLQVTASQIREEGGVTRAHWDAHYTFPFLGGRNTIDNPIDATFTIEGGKILRHTDVFDLRRWMRMALSPLGGLVTEGTIKSAVQSRLDSFIESHPEFQDTKP
jgi:hypothetical protein